MSGLQRGPAYRIETDRLLLRCFEPGDAAMLKTAIDANLDHLRQWLSWARDEPQPLDAKVELLRQFRGQFDLGQSFRYGIFDPVGTGVIGGCGLHARPGDGAREIGYWIGAAHSGKGFAAEAAAALVRVGFEVEELERIEILCDVENVRSAAVARKVGFRHDANLRSRVPRREGPPGDRMIWSMLRGEYPESPCARARLLAFDAMGRVILEGREARASRSSSAFR